jgi:hypothetical protein
MPVATIHSISAEEIQFEFISKDKARSLHALQWRDIQSIEVFKRDLWAYDLICLRFRSSHGEPIEIDEDDPSWLPLLQICPTYLETFQPWETWFVNVAFPAFETNFTTVYSRN